MNDQLWKKITDFDLDYPLSEYGFSTRLADENRWTKNFTADAVTEYKKFMYLAATSDGMVSPSEMADIVWHQHLIFTQSYADFCRILGKNIEHIPSTHNRAEAEKFSQAKERTAALYKAAFGEQPAEIWEYDDMYASLELETGGFDFRLARRIAPVVFLALIYPCFYLFRPVYIQISGPLFLTAYPIIIAGCFAFLYRYNKMRLNKMIGRLPASSFTHHLDAYELVYLKERNLPRVVNGMVDQLIKQEKILVTDDARLLLRRETEFRQFPPRDMVAVDDAPLSLLWEAENAEEFTIMETLQSSGGTNYRLLAETLAQKPAIRTIAQSMDGFVQYFQKTKIFSRLFYLNYAVMGSAVMIGAVRLATGLSRGRPTGFLIFLMIFLTYYAVFFLGRLSKTFFTDLIPRLYQAELNGQEFYSDSWDYFLRGREALSPVFLPLAVWAYPAADGGGGSGGDGGGGCGGGGGAGGAAAKTPLFPDERRRPKLRFVF